MPILRVVCPAHFGFTMAMGPLFECMAVATVQTEMGMGLSPIPIPRWRSFVAAQTERETGESVSTPSRSFHLLQFHCHFLLWGAWSPQADEEGVAEDLQFRLIPYMTAIFLLLFTTEC